MPAMAACAAILAASAQAQGNEDVLIQGQGDVVVELDRKESRAPRQITAKAVELQARKAETQAREAASHAWETASDAARAAMDQAKTHIRVLHQGLGAQASSDSLVVSHELLGPDAQKGMEEDLAIMSRILGKVVDGAIGGSDGPQRRAMGIPIFRNLGPGSPRNIYIEGHGVVFLLDINMPLKPTPSSGDSKANAPARQSEWESARKELFGGDSQNADVLTGRHKSPGTPNWFGLGADGAARYDAGKAEKLRADLVEAVKHASNIRGLKPGEAVTLVIRGPVATVKEREVKSVDQDGEVTVSEDVLIVGGEAPKVSMVISVQQELAAAYAQGKASLEDLKAGARVTVY